MELFDGRVVYRGEGALVSFGLTLSFAELRDKIRARFLQLQNESFGLKFSVHPDTTLFQLLNESDMRFLFRSLDRAKSDFVDIIVHDLGGASSGNAINVISNSDAGNCDLQIESDLHEPNEFLGCFRREDPKVYISNSWKSFIAFKGQTFEGGVTDFRTKLRMYAIEVGFEFDLQTNKAHRVVAYCTNKATEGCQWRVKASLVRHNNFFQIYELMNEHQCRSVVRVRNSKMLSSDIVKKVMLEKVRDNPNVKAIEIQQDLKLNYGLDIPYHKAWYGKELAREEILGDEAKSYRELKWFGERTIEANPGTRIHIDCSDISGSDPGKMRFQRMFMAYGALLNGFQFCRPVLHIDATFITNKYKGMLLAATAKDANSGLYPVAYAIVDSETEDNWTYFFSLLKVCLDSFPPRTITFISDRNIGLLNAVRNVFPDNPLGFCYRHLQTNLLNKFPASSSIGKTIQTLFMRAAYSRTPEYFEINLQKLRHQGGVVVDNFLKGLPKETWAACHFNGERFGEMTNNLAECFNSWIKTLKGLPIVQLNEALRKKIMSLIATRKHGSSDWVSVLCPNLEKKLAANMELGRHWIIIRANTFLYEVQCLNYTVKVNLENSTCSCGEWQLHGFPCSHAIASVQKHGSDVYAYVNPIFEVSQYRNTYSFTINPVPSISKEVDMNTIAVDVEPPLTKRPAGRPRVERQKSKNERKRLLKCGRCQKFAGHNKTTCKEII